MSLGLKDAGYEYVNLDGALSLGSRFPAQPTLSVRQASAVHADGWARRTRNGSQPINYNATRFPNGIKALAAYVHAKGLKLGIYSDSGNLTCAGYTASLGFEEEDAAQFADWDVDLLKVWDARLRSLRCASGCRQAVGTLTTAAQLVLLPVRLSSRATSSLNAVCWGKQVR